MKEPNASKPAQPPGFTLIEVMVAVSLMTIVLVAVLSLHMQTVTLANTAKFYSIAPQLARKALTDVELTLIENERNDFSGNFGDRFPGYGWAVRVDHPVPESVDSTMANLTKIDVEITLYEREFVYRLRTYRFLQD